MVRATLDLPQTKLQAIVQFSSPVGCVRYPIGKMGFLDGSIDTSVSRQAGIYAHVSHIITPSFFYFTY